MRDQVQLNIIDNRSWWRRLLRVTNNVKEHVEITMRSIETGEIVSKTSIYNTVTTAGKNTIADQLLAAPTLGKPTHMAIGTGAPGANALGVEVSRVALTSKTRATNVVTMVGDFPAGTPAGTNVITEAGIFDAASVGNATNTTSFGGQSKDPSLAMTINWTLTVN